MVTVVLAAPYTPPVPSFFSSWRGIRHTLTGWDGSVWNISDHRSGVFLVGDGVEGLGMPEILNQTHDSPIVHGIEWDGWLATGRKVFWSIGVYHDGSSSGWIERNRAFWKIFRPGKTILWTVELPTGEKFNLTVRFKSDGGYAPKRDPAVRGWEVYGIECFPEQPFWEADPIIQSWAIGEQVDFFGPTGFGPDFYISPSSTLATAKVSNPGDVESYITWTVVGPATTAQVGIGDEITTIPFAVPDGSKLVLKTDPRVMTAELDGTDVTDQIPTFSYPGLPPGEDIELSLALDGTGSVEAQFPVYVLMGV